MERFHGITRLLLISVVLINGIVGGNAHSKTKTDIDQYLMNINKPAVKTIHVSDNGDIVDCVGINKQPAFDHPLLKNHTIQMAPSFAFESEVLKAEIEWTWKKSGSCPKGTVPIRRTTKTSLREAISFEKFGRKDVSGGAVVEYARNYPDYREVPKPLYGTKGAINIWNVYVEPNEWSQSLFVVGNMDGPAHSFIEAGYSIYPKLFGDNNTRLYAYWTTDGYNSTGCYNILCPGFVQVSRKIMLGGVLTPVSSYGGRQTEIYVAIFRDQAFSKWWLRVQGEDVGYWPESIFMSFTTCSIVKWGGEVLNKSNQQGRHTATKMGSGKDPSYGYSKSAYMSQIQVYDKASRVYTPKYVLSETTHSRCYDEMSAHIPGQDYSMYFGGAGGPDCF